MLNKQNNLTNPASDVSMIKSLNRFFSSELYPMIFAYICVFSSAIGYKLYIPCLWLLIFTSVYNAIFNTDTRPLIVPFFMAFYALGTDTTTLIDNPSGSVFAAYGKTELIQLFMIIALWILSVFYRLAVNGNLKLLTSQKNHFLFGLLIFDAALLLNGSFSGSMSFNSLLYALLCVIGLTLSYLLIRAILFNTVNTVEYLCKTVVCFGHTVFLQLCILYIKLIYTGKLLYYTPGGNLLGLNRYVIVLPWGVSTMIGAAIIMAIPAALYLAYTKNKGSFYYISAFIFLCGAIMVNARAAMLGGALCFLTGAVLCSFFGTNRFTCHICNCILLLISGLAILALTIKSGGFFTLLKYLRVTTDDSGRLEVWEEGLRAFFTAPIFGNGLTDPTSAIPNDYSVMYHNIVVQLLASLGIFGMLAFLFHIKDLFMITFNKFSKEKLLLFLSPILIITVSLFDNFFFYLNFQMIYGAFLAAIEVKNNEKNILS